MIVTARKAWKYTGRRVKGALLCSWAILGLGLAGLALIPSALLAIFAGRLLHLGLLPGLLLLLLRHLLACLLGGTLAGLHPVFPSQITLILHTLLLHDGHLGH